jgi:hypothetical protein
MTKEFYKHGFVIFSNDADYELGILGDYFLTESGLKNIIFVYSQKAPVDLTYTNKLLSFGKNLLVIPFEEYNKIEYASAVEALDLNETVMIIKDLRFMLKRLDERLSMMQIKHVCSKKIIIDRVPFLVDMWKLYFNYSFFDKTLLGYSHSYAFEAAVRNYEEDRALPDPYDPFVLANRIKKATFINFKELFTFKVHFKIYEVTEAELRGYEDLKEKLFSAKTGVKKIISQLYKYASKLVPAYNVPLKLESIYDWKGSEIIIQRTNLKVDTYLCSELEALINRGNALTGYLYGD